MASAEFRDVHAQARGSWGGAAAVRGIRIALLAGLGALLMLAATARVGAAAAVSHDLQPRPAVIKPERSAVDPLVHEQRVILVKFIDERPVRLRNGELAHLGPEDAQWREARALLAAIPPGGGHWERLTDVPEDRLDELRLAAQRNLDRAVADMNAYFHLFLPPPPAFGSDVAEVLDALNALEIVELAEPVSRPTPLPLPPNFQPNQGYLNAATTGIDAYFAWNQLGWKGEGVRIVDIEYNFNPSHLDLPTVTIVGPSPQNPPGISGNQHGTAVLGQLGSIGNGWGTTGIAPASDLFFAGAYTNNTLNVAGAIITATANTFPGDVILIEAQAFGPNSDPQSGTCVGCVPVEWRIADYNAIVTAVGNGRIVVAAAGNGAEDLDAPIYSQGNNGHWPFLAANDSGSIIVGAGHAPFSFGGSGVDRSRIGFSTWGSRVNVQGWGEAVWTTGYGSAYSAEGPNLWYTGSFAGTSSASPIVAGAAALLQSAVKDVTGAPISPLVLRQALVATGSPQQSGANPASQNIGPRPNVKAAMEVVIPPPPSNNVCNAAINVLEGDTPFNNFGATTEGPEEPLCDFAGDANIKSDVWFRHTAQCTGTLFVRTCNSPAAFDTKLAVYDVTCPTAPGAALVCNKDHCGQRAAVQLQVTAGQTYRIRIGGHNGVQNEGILTVACFGGAPEPCPADLTGSGAVGVPDLLELLAAWGPCIDPSNCPADLTESGSVGVPDLLELLAAWGSCPE